MLNGLDLFTGIAGLTVALEPWVRPVAYCERDRHAAAVVLSRIAALELPPAPIWDDVTTLRGEHLDGVPIDIIYGGFPCQDLSVAGLGAGLAGKRSGLFFEIARLARDLRPSFVFLENVPAIRTRGADVVAGRLASLGYDCRWAVLSAFDMGAPHLRERWWLLAYRDGDGRQRESERNGDEPLVLRPQWSDTDRLRLAVPDAMCERGRPQQVAECRCEGAPDPDDDGAACALADADRPGSPLTARPRPAGRPESPLGDWWIVEPDVGRVAPRVPQRVDRLRALGNSVVPACAREAFARLAGLKS